MPLDDWLQDSKFISATIETSATIYNNSVKSNNDVANVSVVASVENISINIDSVCKPNSVMDFVLSCITGHNTDAVKIINYLLSTEDEIDIKFERITKAGLTAAISWWVEKGMPNISGKN